MKSKKEVEAINQRNKELFERYKNGDLEARDLIIEGNINLVRSVARKYLGVVEKKPALTPYDYEDLVSVGTIGLIRAVDKYDPQHSSNSTFASYAHVAITNEIIEFLRVSSYQPDAISLNEIVPELSDGARQTEIIDTLSNGEQPIDETICEKLMSERLFRLASTVLTRSQIKLLKLSYIDDEPTVEEIGEEMGCSRQNISRKRLRALNKLRQACKNDAQLCTEIRNPLQSR